MRTPIALAITVALLAAAGCIQSPSDNPASRAAALVEGDWRDVDSSAQMSARERTGEGTEDCASGGGVCAYRSWRIEGEIALDSLPVHLETVSGSIDVVAGKGDAWSMDVIIEARGATAAEAMRHAKAIRFDWSHRDSGGHHLEAVATFPRESGEHHESASIVLTMPESVVLELSAENVNGGIEVRDVRTDGLSLQLVNGGTNIKAAVTSVAIEAVNGGIEARLTPTASGRISIDSVNGGIELYLPENGDRGYDVEAESVNGGVDIRLDDGTTAQPDESRQTFRTDGFESRAIQTHVAVETVNGGVDVSPD